MIKYSKIVGLTNMGMVLVFIPLMIIFFKLALFFVIIMVAIGILELFVLYKIEMEKERKKLLKISMN